MIHPDNLVHPDLTLGERDAYPAHAWSPMQARSPKHTHYIDHKPPPRPALPHCLGCGDGGDWARRFRRTARASRLDPVERHRTRSRICRIPRSGSCSARPEAARHLPAEPAVVRLTPLLRELILAFMSYSPRPPGRGSGRPHRRCRPRPAGDGASRAAASADAAVPPGCAARSAPLPPTLPIRTV